MSTLSVRTFTS